MTYEDIQQFEMDIGRAKFDPNEDTDGLPMMEVEAKIIEHVFKNAVNLKETPYVIYKDRHEWFLLLVLYFFHTRDIGCEL